jgi:putative methyltransferase (TIGR04325 family)
MLEPLGATHTLYCASVLQYFQSNDEFLALVERSHPEFILLEDLVATANEDFFSVQMFRGSAIPYRFLGLQSLLRELAVAGYFVLARYPYLSPIRGLVAPLPMDNFPPFRQLRYCSSVLLKCSALT